MPTTAVHAPTDLTASETFAVLASTARVLLDSNRTEDIIVAEEGDRAPAAGLPARERVMAEGEGPDLMRDRPDFADLDLDEMRALPEGTLGRELARFFDDNGLDTKLYGIPASSSRTRSRRS